MPITLSRIIERRGAVDFDFMGEEVHVEYHIERITKEFRAEALRLNREVLKSEKRVQKLLETVNLVVAEDGTVEAETEDEAAKAAIASILATDEALKHDIDTVIATIVISWDLLGDDGKPVPITISKDGKDVPAPELFKVPSDFEGAVLTAVLEDGSMGEANGAKSTNSLPSPSRQVAKLATSRRSQTGGRISRRQR